MIRVHIEPGMLHASNHDVLIGKKIVSALKAAGVPIEASAFVLRSVKHGKLEYWMEGRTHVFNWRENEQDASNAGLERSFMRDGVTVLKNGTHLEDDEL